MMNGHLFHLYRLKTKNINKMKEDKRRQKTFRNEQKNTENKNYQNNAKPSVSKEVAHKESPWNAVGKWMPAILAILFSIIAFYVLVGLNSDYLFAAQEHSLWFNDDAFWCMLANKPARVMLWIGCYLTQFFYTPWVGSLLLIIIWLLTFFVTLKAFNIKGWWSIVALLPIAALLCSVIDLGYWLYYCKVDGYWFAESIGVLAGVSAVWGYRFALKKNSWISLGVLIVWAVVGYVLFGWYGLISTASMAVVAWREDKKAALWASAAAVLLIIAIPIICYNFFAQMRIEDAWIVGFPLFQMDQYTSWVVELPFILIGIFFLALPFCNVENVNKVVLVIINVACIAAIGYGIYCAHFDDYNYHGELRMYRAVDESRWGDALEIMVDNPGHSTREMVLFKNLALTNQGTIGANMFKYDNQSIIPAAFDSIHVHMVQTNAPLLYYYYGRCNFATRWCIENSVEYGFTVDIYKILTRCALISGEPDVARKYINILKKTTFYKKWAEQYEPFVNDTSLLRKSDEFKNMIEYHDHFKSVLDGDEGLVELYLLNYFSNTQNKDSELLNETTLAFALISKDIQRFWPRFFLYATLHRGEPMPKHYQEAAFLYGNLEHEVDISTMPFDRDIVDRYASFQQLSQSLIAQGMTVDQVGEAMKASYGDTFWWFYFFCRDIKSY